MLHNVEDRESVATYVTVGLCFGCGRNLNEISKGIECAFCFHMYHLTCLAKDEYCDLGIDESILFICKPCQKNLVTN